MQTVSEEKAHATFGASSSERWMECPASIALCEKAPPQKQSEYASEGTDAHSVLEAFLKNPAKRFQTETFLKQKYPLEMVLHGMRAATWIINQMSKGAVLLSETRVDASAFTREGEFGTLDAAIVEEFGTLTVCDYKYGQGVAVEAEGNTQMLYYALGIAERYNYNFSRVRMVILQPRAEHEKGPIREWVITIDELLEWKEKFKAGVERALDPLAEFKHGKWCRWCPAAPLCPEISEKAITEAKLDFDDLVEGKQHLGPPEAIPYGKVGVPKLGKLLTLADKLEDWIKALREHAQNVLERGEKIEGWKLVDKRSIRKWKNEERAVAEAKQKFGKLAFTDPELLSPAQLEKAVAPRLRPQVDKFIEKHASAESSGTTLAPESDKRPPVKPPIETDFTEVVPYGEQIVLTDQPYPLPGEVPFGEFKETPKRSKTTKRISKKKGR